MAHTLRHFCSFSSIGTDTRCCSTPCRFCFESYTCMRCYCPPVLGWTRHCSNAGGGIVCLFIDLFCDLCPTRHHKRGASRDYSQQNSSIALLLSPCLRGTATKLQGVTVGVTARPINDNNFARNRNCSSQNFYNAKKILFSHYRI